jgi:hypothetical protein
MVPTAGKLTGDGEAHGDGLSGWCDGDGEAHCSG